MHRGMTGSEAQKREFSSEINRSVQAINRHFSALDDLQSKFGQSHLLPESLLLELRRNWQSLSGSTDTFHQHTELLEKVKSALKLLGKTPNNCWKMIYQACS